MSARPEMSKDEIRRGQASSGSGRSSFAISPSAARVAEATVPASDGIGLFVRHYEPVERPASRALVIVHGMSEHGGRYDHVARMFVEAGWNVVVGDQRGHGRSGGVKTHVDRFEQYLQDLDSIWQYFELQPQRTALLGHSMGSLVSARFAETRPERMRAVLLLAPLLKLKVVINPLTIALGRFVSLFAPQTRFRSRVDPADTTRCPEALGRRADDPLIHRSITAGCYFALKRAMREAWRDAGRLKRPLLVMQGDLDRIVDPSVLEAWLAQVGSADKTLLRFSEHLHELHNEPDWPETVGKMIDWLDVQLPAVESSPGMRVAAR